MSATRRIVTTLAGVLDRLGLPFLVRRIVVAIYTHYKTRDLAAFGSGSTIHPFSIIQGGTNIRIGSGTHIRPGCRLQADAVYGAARDAAVTASRRAPELRIGDRTLVGRYCHFTAQARIEIGEDVLFGERILVTDHDHGFEEPGRPPRDQPLGEGRPVRIGDACWIGDGAAILAGSRLGRHVVVGANAVVRGEVPDFTVIAGNPARPVKRYDVALGKWVDVERKNDD